MEDGRDFERREQHIRRIRAALQGVAGEGTSVEVLDRGDRTPVEFQLHRGSEVALIRFGCRALADARPDRVVEECARDAVVMASANPGECVVIRTDPCTGNLAVHVEQA